MKNPSRKRTFAQGVSDDAKRRTSARALSEAAASFEDSIGSHVASGLGERIEQLVDLFPTQKEAAEFVGHAPKTLQNWVSGATVPAFDVLARMAAEKNVSLAWLASGIGSMKAGDLAPVVTPGEFVYLPRYDVRAGAGNGQIVESENIKSFLAFREDWVRTRLRRNPAHLVVFEAYGDSMYPTISDGDIMLVDTSEERVRGPAIYVVLAGNEAIVKRVELKIDGSLLVKSDNPTYEPMTLKGEQIAELRVLGKVVWAGGLV